jgi:hypothetical protein
MSSPVLTAPVAFSLPPVPRYEVGTILTLWMRGHSRTNGVDYYTPAMVLEQYNDGSIDALVFDTTSGVSFSHAYRVREESVDNNQTPSVPFVSKDNVGAVLFDPCQMTDFMNDLAMLKNLIIDLQTRVLGLEGCLSSPSAPTSQGSKKS